jgi:hypothetical protein
MNMLMRISSRPIFAGLLFAVPVAELKGAALFRKAARFVSVGAAMLALLGNWMVGAATVQALLKDGMWYAPEGNAQLSLGPDNELIVSGLGNTGQDGFSADITGAQGWSGEFTPFPLAENSVMLGRLIGVNNQLLAQDRLEFVNGRLLGSANWSFLSNNFEFQELLFEVRDERQRLLDRRPVLPGQQVDFTAYFPLCDEPGPLYHCRREIRENLTWWRICWPDCRMLGTAIVERTYCFVTRLPDPPPPKVRAVTIITQRAGTLALQSSSMHMLSHGHTGLGTARLDASSGMLGISPFGNTGRDGVEITLSEASRFRMAWRPPDPNNTAPTGSMMRFSIRGVTPGVVEQLLGSIDLRKRVGGIEVVPDFRAAGSVNNYIEVRLNGGMVHSNCPLYYVVVATAPLVPDALEIKMPLDASRPVVCASLRWNQGVAMMTAEGQQVIGDEVLIVPERVSASATALSRLRLEATGFKDLLITSETSETRPRIEIAIDAPRAGESFFNLSAWVPVYAVATLQENSTLAANSWQDVGTPVVSVNGGWPIQFAVPLDVGDAAARFFRVKADVAQTSITDDGQNIRLTVANPTPAYLLFEQMRDRFGAVFATETGNPARLVGPLDISAPNLADLLVQAGLSTWVTPPLADDPAEAARRLGQSTLQTAPLPPDPGDVGTGKMDQGYPGNPNLPTPPQGPADPGLDPNAQKGFDPNIQPTNETVPQEDDPGADPGRHIRLLVEVAYQGGLTAQLARERPGPYVESGWTPAPGEDSVVYVVRSPLAPNAPGSIYFIGTRSSPFEIRAYNPPEGGAHGNEFQDRASLALPVPVLPTDQTLNGLVVQFYRVTGEIPALSLSPTDFLQNTQRFVFLGQISGQEINGLLQQAQFMAAGGATAPPRVTEVHKSGRPGRKYNLVVMGDGFQDTPTDQALFNNYVHHVILQQWLTNDIHPEILNAMNIYRVNTFSEDSGVTRVDANGRVTLRRDTALGFRYSGEWSRCWTEGGDGVMLAATLAVPEVDQAIVVLNETSGGGGCTRGNYFTITLADDWATSAHEFGHLFGDLGDEYFCAAGSMRCFIYSGDEPGRINLTQRTDRDRLKWGEWIPATRPVPTMPTAISDSTQDVGLFPGATRSSRKYWRGIFRPSNDGRMQNNSPPHNPVGYTRIRERARNWQEGDFRKTVVGDFNGDGRTDLVLLDDSQLSLYLAANRTVGPNDPITGRPPRPVSAVLEPTWYRTGSILSPLGPRLWSITGSDILLPGDFDGDGKDDLYVVNLTGRTVPFLGLLRSTGSGFEAITRYAGRLPGWGEMRKHDEFYVADFDGDGRKDLLVFNGRDWEQPHLSMLRSSGFTLEHVHRYDRFLPDGVAMGRHEKLLIGDFNGDGRADVAFHNAQDWRHSQLMIYRSTGLLLAPVQIVWASLTPDWALRQQDEIHVLDFNGDRRSDLAIFNGRDWSVEYLGLFVAQHDGAMSLARRFDDTLPGWDMKGRDRFHVANFDGDADDDLVVFNARNWSHKYLGMLRSDGTGDLTGSWQQDRIGAWELSGDDAFHVADCAGFFGLGLGAGWVDLIAYNKERLGLLRSYRNRYELEALYPKWIHNHRFHAFGWW